MKLTPRLRALLRQCAPGRPLVDMCCDHGYLALAAARSGRFPMVIFNDKASHLIGALKARVADLSARHGAPDTTLLFHAGDAADIPLPDTPCNVVIAGVGANTIRHIITRQGVGPHRWILSPHWSADELQEHLSEHPSGATLSVMPAVEERGRRRPIWVFEGP